MGLMQNLDSFKRELPSHVQLVAVSKTKTPEIILEGYHAGYKIFGENKAQELFTKHMLLPKDIKWHFIGHLQTNKVKYIVTFVSMIQSIDSLKLLVEVNKQAHKHERIIDCLLQFHIASEESKFGLDYSEACELLKSSDYLAFSNIRICGVMGMATFTTEENLLRNEFKKLKNYFDLLKNDYFLNKDYFREISMGMSNDYKIAIEEGSTIVRIGTAIFGER